MYKMSGKQHIDAKQKRNRDRERNCVPEYVALFTFPPIIIGAGYVALDCITHVIQQALR